MRRAAGTGRRRGAEREPLSSLRLKIGHPAADLVAVAPANDHWLDYIDLDWIEQDESIDALLRDVAVAEKFEASSDEAAV